MAVNSRRNYSLDFLKLFFTLFIILHHSQILTKVLFRGYIPVEFFFFVSGYFIYTTSKKDITFLQFIKRRIKKLYPEYISALILLLIAIFMVSKHLYKTPLGAIYETLMLHGIGLPHTESYNFPTWYISVLFYGGALIFLGVKFLNTKCFNVVGAIIVALTYSYLIFQIHGVEYWKPAYGIFFIPFWRGVSDMIIGMWLYQLPKPPVKLGKYIQIIALIFSVVLMFIPGNLDFIAIVFLIALVYTSANQDNMLNKIGGTKILRNCYDYQYSAYLNHALVVYINIFAFEKIEQHIHVPAIIKVFILFITVICVTFVVKKITDFSTKRLCSVKKNKE